MSAHVVFEADEQSLSLPVPPQTIIVELTNVCDLKCPLCTTYVGMQRANGFMKFELFAKIIDELKSCDPKPTISMNMSGEPLLHREVDRFVSYAFAHRSSNVYQYKYDTSDQINV